MAKQRINLTLHPDIIEMAEALKERDHFSSLSTLLEDLIRSAARRQGIALNDAPIHSRATDDADETPSARVLRAGAADARAAAAPGADTPVLYPGPRKAASTRRRPAPGQVASKPSTSHPKPKC